MINLHTKLVLSTLTHYTSVGKATQNVQVYNIIGKLAIW